MAPNRRITLSNEYGMRFPVWSDVGDMLLGDGWSVTLHLWELKASPGEHASE